MKQTTDQVNTMLIPANIKIVGEYVNNLDHHTFKCLKCDHMWSGRPFKVKAYKCCPNCRKQYYNSPYGENNSKIDRGFIKRTSQSLINIIYKGGVCQECNLNLIQNFWLADYHHINPLEKEFEMSKMKSRSWDIVKKELDKCMLLCANCHRSKHFNKDKYDKFKDTIIELSKSLS
jgi:hypothetical protein